MGLEIRRTRDGKWRRNWYGAYMLDGRRYAVSLGVKIAGTSPGSFKLSEEGDIPFERSRAKAQYELDIEYKRTWKTTHLSMTYKSPSVFTEDATFPIVG